MRLRIVILKLAAIGDVAVACRALNASAARWENAEVHWIIDHGLIPLARELTRDCGCRIHWHGINAAGLLGGSVASKARQALRVFSTVARVQPHFLALLHRDWRYGALVRLGFFGRILWVTRSRMNEFDAYIDVFAQIPGRSREKKISAPIPRLSSGRVGFLVGGARNQKTRFDEKRWPRTRECVELLLKKSDRRVVLFGGPDDIELAQEVVAGLDESRIENRVGKLKLEELPRALAELDGFVSPDSGLAHIAAGVMEAPHQRVVVLFGPTDPAQWAPQKSGVAQVHVLTRSKPCAPCYSGSGNFEPCRYTGEQFQNCMKDITADEVIQALQR